MNVQEFISTEGTKNAIQSALKRIDANQKILSKPFENGFARCKEATDRKTEAEADLAMCYLQYQSKCESDGTRPVSMREYVELIRKL